MDITIPDNVEFYTETPSPPTWVWRHYCFRHAVKRAMDGEKIKTKLSSEFGVGCDDCLEKASKQSDGYEVNRDR